MRDATRTSHCESRSGRAQPGSAGDIEDSAVPGTDHFCAVNHPFHQRAASMSTDVVDRIESSIDIKKQGNRLQPISTIRARPGAISLLPEILTNSSLARIIDPFHYEGSGTPKSRDGAVESVCVLNRGSLLCSAEWTNRIFSSWHGANPSYDFCEILGERWSLVTIPSA